MYILTRSPHRPEGYLLNVTNPRDRPSQPTIAAFVADRTAMEMVYDPTQAQPYTVYRVDGRVEHNTQPRFKGAPVKGGFILTARKKATGKPTRGKGLYVDPAPNLSIFPLPHTFRPAPSRDGSYTFTHAGSPTPVQSEKLERCLHHPSYAAYAYAYRVTRLAEEMARPENAHLSHFVVNPDRSITLWYANGDSRRMTEQRGLRRYLASGDFYATDKKRLATITSYDWE